MNTRINSIGRRSSLGATSLRAVLLASAMSATAGVALAQEAAPDAANSSQVEEIMVTALKRNTQLQDTPMSISAVTGETLEKTGAVSMAEYAKFVPSLKLSDDGPGRTRIAIRGIQGAGEAMVGVFYDETPITGSVGVSSDAGGRSPDTSATDVERIEVLRGPQGTLFGGSTMAGAIRLIFKKPTSQYEGFVSGTVTSTDGGESSNQITGMVNVPLISDKLAARVVLYNRENGGWLENTFLHLKNINSSTVKGGRLMVRFTPTDDLTIDAAVHVQKTDAVSNNNWNPGAGKYVQASKLLLPYNEDTRIYSLTANWDLGKVKLTGNTSYFYGRSIYAADDTNFVNGYRTVAQCSTYLKTTCVANTPTYANYLAMVNSYYPAAIYYPSKSTNWTNELRLSSNTDGPLSWTVGAYIENRIEYIESSDVLADESTGIIKTPIKFIYHRYIDDHLTQKAVFGEVSYDLSSKLSITAGGRYFSYHKTVGGATDIGWDLIGAPTKPFTVVEAKENGSIFKVNADYDITDDVMVYGSISEGFRPGGVNQVIGLAADLTPYDSDSLTNYELGAKTAWFNHMLIVNASIYQIDWKNMQVSGRTLNNAFSFISNAGAAKVKGAEIEITATPIHGLLFSANASYNDAKLTEDQVNSSVASTGRAGDRIQNIPKVSGAFSAQYTHDLKDGLQGFVRGDINYVGSSFSELRPTNAFRMKNPSYSLTNLRVGVESNEAGWEAAVFVNNLFNAVAITRITNSSTTPVGGSAVSAMPRTIGASVTKRF
ncbi:MAG: ligand-gated channel protein [Caulobacter sp.]|nr:ligand-gated channel protein [Caulobacter sp.]